MCNKSPHPQSKPNSVPTFAAPPSLQKVHNYDVLIKEKLSSDYGINDIVSYVARREICVFQLKSEFADPTAASIPEGSTADPTMAPSTVGFNQLKDAIDNIINDNKLRLKLISATIVDADTIFNGSRHPPVVQQLQKRPIGIVYLSFLRAIKCFIIHKLSNWHSLFEGNTHGLSLDMVPFGNQLLTSSTIHTVAVSDDSDVSAPKRKRKLFAYSILKVNPSLNMRNDLMVNLATSRKLFYKLSDFLSIRCGCNAELLDRKKNFVVYMCPSGVRCSFAINGSFCNSICDEPPSSDVLSALLQTYANIDLVQDMATQPLQARKWVKLMPSLSHVNGMTERVATFIDSGSNKDRFIVWPIELCFIQFSTDAKVRPEDTTYEMNYPLQLTCQFMDLMEDLEKEKKGIKEESPVFDPHAKLESIKLEGISPEKIQNTEVDQPSGGVSSFSAAPAPSPAAVVLGEPTVESTPMPGTPSTFISPEEYKEKEKVEEDEDDWNELFGDNDEEGNDDEKSAENHKELEKNYVHDVTDTDTKPVITDDARDAASKSIPTSISSQHSSSQVEVSPPLSHKEDSSPVALSPRTSPLYADPGAPEPIPFPIFAAPETPESQVESQNEDTKRSDTGLSTPIESGRSIFAPLNFNPLIEKNIDSKYSSGGKFFVKSNEKTDGSDFGTNSAATSDSVPSFLRSSPSSARKRKFEDDKEDLISDSDEIDSSAVESFEESEEEVSDVKKSGSSPNHDKSVTDNKNASRLGRGPGPRGIRRGGNNDDEGEENDDEGGDGDDDDDDSEMDDFSDSDLSVTALSTDLVTNNEIKGSGLLASPIMPQAALFGRTSQDASNWIFWILRGPATYTVPSHFLAGKRLSLPKSRLASVIPILQEFLLYSQHDLESRELNSLIQRRDCPAMPDFDVEFVLQKVFPGVQRTHLVDMLDASPIDPEEREKKAEPFECLFGINPPDQLGEYFKPEVSKQMEYDDPTFSAATPMGQHSQQPTPQPRHAAVRKVSKGMAVSPESMFIIPPTVLNLRRLGEEIKINEASVPFWKPLNLQVLHQKKNFQVLFVVPKPSNDFFRHCLDRFLDTLIQSYQTCGLGKISKAADTGLMEIEASTDSRDSYWAKVMEDLISSAPNLQQQIMGDMHHTEKMHLLVLFATPFRDLVSLLQMSTICAEFNSRLILKSISVKEENGRKKRRKAESLQVVRLPIALFYKAVSLDTFYPNSDAHLSFTSTEDLIRISLNLYNLCPDGITLKDRKPFGTIAQEMTPKINFRLTKSPIAKNLIEDELFLHVCYERSVDRRWCVASWTDQYGSINYVKSWWIDPESEYENFAQVADDLFRVTLKYVDNHHGKVCVVLARLNNMIPDDELSEWKRLSLKNDKLGLIVLTVEMESSSLILSNNVSPDFLKKRLLGQALAPANLQGMTPSFGMTPGVGNTPDISSMTPLGGYITTSASHNVAVRHSPETPYYDFGSPLDASHYHQNQNQHLQSLIDRANGFGGPPTPLAKSSVAGTSSVVAAPSFPATTAGYYANVATPGNVGASSIPNTQGATVSSSPLDPVILDIARECYGLVFQVSQPLSQQSIRLPLRTGFLVNSGSGACKNRILEVNLLSHQSGINSSELFKKILIQFKNLSVSSSYYDVLPAKRRCGNVEPKDNVIDDEDELFVEDDAVSSVAPTSVDANQSSGSSSAEKTGDPRISQQQQPQFQSQQKSQRNSQQAQMQQQQQYHQYYRQQKKKKSSRAIREEEGLFDYDKQTVIPPHISSVRKMLDFLVQINMK
ncbi:hypothetical protein FOA43_000634 [Brettanomyces nanus]|uniref:Mediator of RNA polymerase II transcription subunit 13 n=1 Tax=Eeniella nana TaxID=13502 RepID=A0A875S1Q4_EENNA|nr:uncharacterized protein FOA43_000634 [Brettanomyces nanus]QPG73324.1 hypothetical protein FOA43_000634 [Brettanomyces nanus]